ncbi:unnamed protein product [Arabis nemorensis]|uniref:Uncharacterized protein n=1 Tax=Arabis nemorensis TaxID=586526 RepID=A0A565CDF6_9BRAS|nr:unnamed protein product [Arabis nemorensis]
MPRHLPIGDRYTIGPRSSLRSALDRGSNRSESRNTIEAGSRLHGFAYASGSDPIDLLLSQNESLPREKNDDELSKMREKNNELQTDDHS